MVNLIMDLDFKSISAKDSYKGLLLLFTVFGFPQLPDQVLQILNEVPARILVMLLVIHICSVDPPTGILLGIAFFLIMFSQTVTESESATGNFFRKIFSRSRLARDPVEISGTINHIAAVDTAGIQKVTVTNAKTSSSGVSVEPTIVVYVKPDEYLKPPAFVLNAPIVAKGMYTQKAKASDPPTYLQNVYAPSGYVRYNGVVYS